WLRGALRAFPQHVPRHGPQRAHPGRAKGKLVTRTENRCIRSWVPGVPITLYIPPRPAVQDTRGRGQVSNEHDRPDRRHAHADPERNSVPSSPRGPAGVENEGGDRPHPQGELLHRGLPHCGGRGWQAVASCEPALRCWRTAGYSAAGARVASWPAPLRWLWRDSASSQWPWNGDPEHVEGAHE